MSLAEQDYQKNGRGGMPVEALKETVDVYRQCAGNISEVSRRLGKDRHAIRYRLERAMAEGLIEDIEFHQNERSAEYQTTRERKLAAFRNKRSKGSWRKPVLKTLPEGPFRLKIFGDPHLDDDGCDFELFERHWLEMSVEDRCYGVCVGDFFNNWVRVLQFNWKDNEPASPAWILFEGLMEARGEALLGCCSGNHDDWTHAPIDPVEMLMRQNGVSYRIGAIRLAIKCGEADPLTIAMRHKWRGSSIYSAAHGIRRAVEKGWMDTIAIGGHIHQDELRHYIHPETGKICTICQVSAFKQFDQWAEDIQGFQGPKISPIWDLVIDPRLPDTSPDKVKVFWDSKPAQAYLEAIT